MDSNGNNPMRLTINNSFDDFPRYSPDGAKIAYASQPNGGQVQIWLMNSDGSDQTQLTTEGISASDVPFTWSPAGNIIVYIKFRYDQFTAQTGTLWLLNVNTGQEQQLTFNPVSSN
jgi:Tol biopolymer transport system component